MPVGLPVSTIIVAHQIGRSRAPRKCLHDLLGQPLRRRMPGHRKLQQLPPSVAHNKCKQALEGQGRNHAQINRSNRRRMVAQERPPALGWRSSALDHVLRNRRLGDLEPKLQEFIMDARGSPQWFSAFIRRMRSRSSRLILGLPARPRDFQHQ